MIRAKAVLMPHYKCEACKTRLYSAGSPAELLSELCPDCGSLLKPVERSSEVIGFRSITSRAEVADSESPKTNGPITEPVNKSVPPRAATLAEGEPYVEPWLDEGDSYPAEAIALAL